MIKIANLEKIYRTDEVETVALNKLSFEVKLRSQRLQINALALVGSTCVYPSRSDKLTFKSGAHPASQSGFNRSGWVSFAKIRTPGKGLTYESLFDRCHPQPCGHWTRRRREDAVDQFPSLRRRHNTTLG